VRPVLIHRFAGFACTIDCSRRRSPSAIDATPGVNGGRRGRAAAVRGGRNVATNENIKGTKRLVTVKVLVRQGLAAHLIW
jgi:hypothetical protein